MGASPCCSPQASHCGGFSCHRTQALGTWAAVIATHGLSSCSVACGILSDRDWTSVPCIGRRILIHCTTREVLLVFYFYFYCGLHLACHLTSWQILSVQHILLTRSDVGQIFRPYSSYLTERLRLLINNSTFPQPLVAAIPAPEFMSLTILENSYTWNCALPVFHILSWGSGYEPLTVKFQSKVKGLWPVWGPRNHRHQHDLGIGFC